jgi:hypothetical protein
MAELKLERLRYLKHLQDRAATVNVGVARYYDDPLGFAADCIDWRGGPGLADYQQDIINTLHGDHRCAVRGPHGLGKSAIGAVSVLWFALTRDAAGVDWKVVTTAGAWRQLIHATGRRELARGMEPRSIICGRRSGRSRTGFVGRRSASGPSRSSSCSTST